MLVQNGNKVYENKENEIGRATLREAIYLKYQKSKQNIRKIFLTFG